MAGGDRECHPRQNRSHLAPVETRPMPAMVSEAMPELLAHLESVLKTKAQYVAAGLKPALTFEAITKLEQQYHVQLPDDIKAIYEWHDGSMQTTNYLRGDFIPTHRFVSLEEALEESANVHPEQAPLVQRLAYNIFAGHRATWIGLFSDGAGDGYWLDPKRKPSEGAVFYNFTETRSYLFFPSAKNLIAGIAQCYEQDAFHIKPNSSPPELDEDYGSAIKIWERFGASN